MIDSVKYALLCEDKAQSEFLHLALSCFTEGKISFEYIETPIEATTRKEVENFAYKACKIAFRNPELNMFFICRDVDSHQINKFNEIYKKLENSLTEYRNRSVIMLSVQCIEHWLLYLKFHKDNPSSTKNPNLETQTRNFAKKSIYGRIKPSWSIQKPIIQELMQVADLEKLSHHSLSFRIFKGEFSKILQPLLQAKQEFISIPTDNKEIKSNT